MKSLFVALLLLVLASSVSAQSKQCRALILEGGGPRNAYTAGVLKAVVELLPKDEYRYDVVSGVSMAAINTFIMGMHAPGDEQAAVKEILNFWENLDEDKVYQSWFLGFLQGLLTKSGLYDLEPFTDTVKDLTDSYKHGFLRKILITVTDLNSGTGAVADETSSLKNFATYLKASAATPGFFPPVVVNNTTLCEGTVVCTANIPDAIETCRLMVDRDEDIILDLVMVQEGNSPSHLIVKSLEKNCSDYTALDMIMRYVSVETDCSWRYRDTCLRCTRLTT
eukprot:TRINITY_DN12571_c0_g1_i8.p1 TRINITY_DN12571_c0_g1~~TRINITY_DN12571_c0_g1_i8.p1  ORF type:complete len:280 (-),score=56.85 TRINITY_DN12571_c0_g1_i8:320-1159(-)